MTVAPVLPASCYNPGGENVLHDYARKGFFRPGPVNAGAAKAGSLTGGANQSNQGERGFAFFATQGIVTLMFDAVRNNKRIVQGFPGTHYASLRLLGRRFPTSATPATPVS